MVKPRNSGRWLYGDEILGHLRQLLDVAAAAASESKFEAAGGAETGNRGWIEHQGNGFADLAGAPSPRG
ncbi:MAG: hypothetical protein R3F40_17825 [Candidatus Competibacteraceae bacterium]